MSRWLLVITYKRFHLLRVSLGGLPSDRAWLDFSRNLLLLLLLHRLLLMLLLWWMAESTCKVLVTAYCSSGCCDKNAAVLVIKWWKSRRLWELSHFRQIPWHVSYPRRLMLENQGGSRNCAMIWLTLAKCKVQWLRLKIVAARRHLMLD